MDTTAPESITNIYSLLAFIIPTMITFIAGFIFKIKKDNKSNQETKLAISNITKKDSNVILAKELKHIKEELKQLKKETFIISNRMYNIEENSKYPIRVINTSIAVTALVNKFLKDEHIEELPIGKLIAYGIEIVIHASTSMIHSNLELIKPYNMKQMYLREYDKILTDTSNYINDTYMLEFKEWVRETIVIPELDDFINLFIIKRETNLNNSKLFNCFLVLLIEFLDNIINRTYKADLEWSRMYNKPWYSKKININN